MGAADAAKAHCETTLTVGWRTAGNAVETATEGAAQIEAVFRNLVDQVNLDGLASGVEGGAAGLKTILLRHVLLGAPRIAWNVIRFKTDVDGLRSGIFDPLTAVINRFHDLENQGATLDTAGRVRLQVELYGDLLALLVEVGFKMYALVPKTVVSVFPVFTPFGLIALPFESTKNPESVDELANGILKQFLRNAWAAVTTGGLSLAERFSLLSYDMAIYQTSSEFAERAGVTDFIGALSRLRPPLDSSHPQK